MQNQFYRKVMLNMAYNRIPNVIPADPPNPLLEHNMFATTALPVACLPPPSSRTQERHPKFHHAPNLNPDLQVGIQGSVMRWMASTLARPSASLATSQPPAPPAPPVTPGLPTPPLVPQLDLASQKGAATPAQRCLMCKHPPTGQLTMMLFVICYM